MKLWFWILSFWLSDCAMCQFIPKVYWSELWKIHGLAMLLPGSGYFGLFKYLIGSQP